jgi:hypothetical protein
MARIRWALECAPENKLFIASSTMGSEAILARGQIQAVVPAACLVVIPAGGQL